ncbi:persephin [Nycticebus coucang]|uniref:persephin n=1 Tax=Nycticebus coucang TaxID=9470 RepID=UPI00234DEB01|nr:persephin [Nycticebus coucang]
MATRMVLLCSLLLLSLQSGLHWGPSDGEVPMAKGELSEQVAEAGRTQLGKDSPGSPWIPNSLLSNLGPISAPFSPPGIRWFPARLRRAPAGPCQLWSLTLPVAELGLGYASEEKVIFRYCAGRCPLGARTQHGLVLGRLRGQGRAHGGPCCLPTHYADVTFLDDRHHWQRLPQLSAAACGCGG